jgi:hypothetical protein
MGFSGGGSNVLLPHTHDGTVSQDGGPLNFNNITQSQSAAGEVFYSDGVHLQQLAYPGVPAGETLTAAAASVAPSWVASPAASAAYEEISSSTLGVNANSISLSFAAVNASDVAGFALFFNGSVNATGTELAVRLEGNSSANYSMQRLDMTGGTGTFSSWTNETHWKPYRATVGSGRVFGQMYIQADQSSQTPNILMTSTFVGSSGQCVYSGNLNITSTSLSEVEIYALDGGSPTIQAGSTLSLFKINI